MSADKPEHAKHAERSADELAKYARELGLLVPAGISQAELIQLVGDRLEVVESIDRAVLQELAAWVRVKVDPQTPNESLVRSIMLRHGRHFDDLSMPALRVLAQLRGVAIMEGESRERIEQHLRSAIGLRESLRKKRRRLVGSLLSRAFEGIGYGQENAKAVENAEPSLKERIQEQGVVGGLAKKLRGVADDYIAEKLDEIEQRIDYKLDEIDRRLMEWRDREVANRLKILKITLVFAILVALLSLGYDYFRSRVGTGPQQPVPEQRAPE